MSSVHEFFTNTQMDGAIFAHPWLYSWMVVHFAGMAARVEGLRGRMSEAGRQVNGLFESLLSQAMDGGR